MAVDQRSGRPVYRQIADELRAAIQGQEIAPGDYLPSEADLVDRYGVSRITVQRATSVLVAEGRVEIERGRGVKVRDVGPVLRLGTDRFSRQARQSGKGALAAEAEAQGLTWRSEDLGTEEVDAPLAVREILGEDRAVVKRRRMWVADRPTQLADSYLPLSLAEQTGYARGATAPGGVYGLIEQHGRMITRYREELQARPAEPEEAVSLDLPIGAPVVRLVRVAYAGDTAVEYFDSVAAGDKHVYRYDFPAPD